jgi:hypothetical protein
VRVLNEEQAHGKAKCEDGVLANSLAGQSSGIVGLVDQRAILGDQDIQVGDLGSIDFHRVCCLPVGDLAKDAIIELSSGRHKLRSSFADGGGGVSKVDFLTRLDQLAIASDKPFRSSLLPGRSISAT